MKDMKQALEKLMIDTGRISAKDRIEITSVAWERWSDWGTIEVYVYHGRRKKPFMYWSICMDVTRETIWWDKSAFQYI